MTVHVSDSFWWFVAAAVLYLIAGRVGSRLRPPFVAMELASSQKHAANVLMEWQQRRQIGRAVATVAIDMVLVASYAAAMQILLFALFRDAAPALNLANGLVMAGVVLAALANWAEDAGLLVTLARGKTYGWLVFVTRIFGWFKYTMMALTLVYLIFRGEVYLYESLLTIVGAHHWKTIGWLTVAMLLLAFLVARRLSTFSQQYPPLLALQLAPDRLTAKGILERWGRRGRRSAAMTLGLQTLLALLYGVTLATLCREINVDAPRLQLAAGGMAWMTIIAAACHVAQNLGAFIAVNRGEMGWWVGPMRRIGKLRIALLGLVGLYFVALMIRIEWRLLMDLADWSVANTPKMPLPWS